MSTVVCLGELVLDRIRDLARSPDGQFENHAAGVAANVAVGVARQGLGAGVIARVGDDAAGRCMAQAIAREGVSVQGISFDPEARTRQACVDRLPNGERRTFSLDSVACADERLTAGDVKANLFAQGEAFYFGSTSMSSPCLASAVEAALALARQHNMVVVCDVNIWPAMWLDDDACRKGVLDTLSKIDVLKLNLGELEFLAGTSSVEAAIKLQLQYQLPLVLLTAGENGAYIVREGTATLVPAYPVETLEVAGAGDAFVAGLVVALLPMLDGDKSRREQVVTLRLAQLLVAVERANACGAMVASRLGALPAMPRSEEIEQFLAKQKGESQ